MSNNDNNNNTVENNGNNNNNNNNNNDNNNNNNNNNTHQPPNIISIISWECEVETDVGGRTLAEWFAEMAATRSNLDNYL